MTLRTLPILEVSGDLMPGWEKKIMELYQYEEGNPIPVIFKGAAKNWEAAQWTPEYKAKYDLDNDALLCAIDITKPDFEKYPELKDIEVYETIIEEGDVLYIPEKWLHDLRALRTFISIASGF